MRQYRKINLGLIFQFLGLILIIPATILIQTPRLLSLGPQGWLQYLIIMFGYLFLLSGLYLDLWVMNGEEKLDTWRRAIIFILVAGGSFLFNMAYIPISYGYKIIYVFIIFGPIFLLLGLTIRFSSVLNKVLDRNNFQIYFVKVILVFWIGFTLAFFLFYWGAPQEFWSIIGRFGLMGISQKVQAVLSHIFSYNN